MRREVLAFLKRERDMVGKELEALRSGDRRVVRTGGGERDITTEAIAEAEARWMRFEEMIAAYESDVI